MLRRILALVEILVLSALILSARCANYRDVFMAGDVFFTDADCYARMTRVHLCAAQPGLIVRHHDFENYPAGTTPHTTAPFDYVILLLSVVLRPITAHPLELAGAIVGPLCGLAGGLFLWWWSRRMKLKNRWALLILYAISPILVHGTELGRPDHQALLIPLLAVAICAEWSWQESKAKAWSIVAGLAWGLAIWVSAYEPLILFALVILVALASPDWRGRFFGRERLTSWIAFGATLGLALLVERRFPSWPFFGSDPILRNWSRTIGELRPLPPLHSLWFVWAGWSLFVLPLLVIWRYGVRRRRPLPWSATILVLLLATYGLTIWQARWGYFFLLLFALALPPLLESARFRILVWVGFICSLYPVLQDWDRRLWPAEGELVRLEEGRREAVALRELGLTMKAVEVRPFLAAWWLSPALTWWSGQPGVAGSSHESVAGIADSARFLMAEEWEKAREILENRGVQWVIAYDGERTAEGCGAVLGQKPGEHALCYVLDRAPAQCPRYLSLAAQNSGGKLFRVANNR